MATCAACGTTILFAGKRVGQFRFCSEKCLARGRPLTFAAQVPDAAVDGLARRILTAPCPKCHGLSPVDVHNAYFVWSALYLTRWSTKQSVVCRSCATKAQVRGLLFSLVLGWWGIPWGFIMTPVQIVRNIGGLRRHTSPTEPSRELLQAARLSLAQSLAAQAPTPTG